MKVLVWQWGRRGAGPRFALELAQAFRRLPDTASRLSLSTGAELLAAEPEIDCDLPVPTYAGATAYARRMMGAPFAIGALAARVRALQADIAICAMPGPLDLLMATACRRAGVRHAVVVHDAAAHPGDGLPLQMPLQRRLLRGADALIALTRHVAVKLLPLARGQALLHASLPPLAYGPPPPPPGAHGGPLRILSFGRLLPYKGLGLLADTMGRLSLRPDAASLRVVGQGPESPALARLRATPGVVVENRWVPEAELGDLLAWADVVLLSHTEASQSGVAAAALASGRWIVGTRVGGMAEQLDGAPGAVLVEPAADALADAVSCILAKRPDVAPARDPQVAWTAMAAGLRSQLVMAGLVDVARH